MLGKRQIWKVRQSQIRVSSSFDFQLILYFHSNCEPCSTEKTKQCGKIWKEGEETKVTNAVFTFVSYPEPDPFDRAQMLYRNTKPKFNVIFCHLLDRSREDVLFL